MWSELEPVPALLAWPEMDDFIVAAPVDKPPAAVQQKKSKTSLLDPQRGQNVEIVLKRIRLPPAAIRAAILSVDDSKLAIDTLKNLKVLAPTAAEVSQISYSSKRNTADLRTGRWTSSVTTRAICPSSRRRISTSKRCGVSQCSTESDLTLS